MAAVVARWTATRTRQDSESRQEEPLDRAAAESVVPIEVPDLLLRINPRCGGVCTEEEARRKGKSGLREFRWVHFAAATFTGSLVILGSPHARSLAYWHGSRVPTPAGRGRHCTYHAKREPGRPMKRSGRCLTCRFFGVTFGLQ